MEIHEKNRIKNKSENYIKSLEDYITNFNAETTNSIGICTALSNEAFSNKLKVEVKNHLINIETEKRKSLCY
jgi:hypothetical protein